MGKGVIFKLNKFKAVLWDQYSRFSKDKQMYDLSIREV